MNVFDYFKAELTKQRKAQRYSRKDLSIMTGISESTIYAIERGSQKPNLEHYAKFLEVFDIPIYPENHTWMTEDEKTGGTEDGTEKKEQKEILHSNNIELSETVPWGTESDKNRLNATVKGTVQKMGYESPDGLQVTILKTEAETVALIPEISDKLAAGMGYYPQDHVLALGTRTFALEWIKSKGLNPQKLRLLRVHGDSMTPVIQDKDMVMLNMGCPPSQAFPVAFRLNNELFIKNYQPQGDGRIHMISRNKNYDPIIINPKSPPEDFEIIGCVVWHAHSYI